MTVFIPEYELHHVCNECGHEFHSVSNKPDFMASCPECCSWYREMGEENFRAGLEYVKKHGANPPPVDDEIVVDPVPKRVVWMRLVSSRRVAIDGNTGERVEGGS